MRLRDSPQRRMGVEQEHLPASGIARIKCFHFLVGHGLPPGIPRVGIVIRVADARAEQRPPARRNKLGDGAAVAGDEDFLALEDLVQELGKLVLASWTLKEGIYASLICNHERVSKILCKRFSEKL